MKRTVSFARNALNVFFHILTRCNLNCRHCYINPEQHGTDTLPAPVINQWLRLFVGGHKTANLILLGGEPTLHPDLADIVKQARAVGYGSITVDTNGFLFNDFLSKVSPYDIDFISFSLDGATKDTNDRIRGRGTYDTCLAGIDQAVGMGFSTSLIYTVSRANIGELSQMIPLVADLGIQRFFIQVIGLRGRSAEQKHDALQVTAQQWRDIVPSVAEKIARSGIRVTYPKVFLAPDEPFECAGRVAENYFVFPNGRVYRCPLCEDYPLHSLAVKDDRLIATEKINEADLFQLDIPEGCVMNKLLQPDNICYLSDGRPQHQIACCLLKEEVLPA